LIFYYLGDNILNKFFKKIADNNWDRYKKIFFNENLFINKIIAVPDNVLEARKNKSNLFQYVKAYRTHGHRIATINPVEVKRKKEWVWPKKEKNI
jgi:2-oxoglutarate dehydrogenase complex dehydrogenase (E1) component-like enzyme